MKMNKILVTGGLGFIGSHCVVELISAGYEVVILDNLSNSTLEVAEHIQAISGVKPKCYVGDVRDVATLESLFQSEGSVDGVVHFAALKAVGESVEKPLEYYDVNVSGLITLVNSMKKFGCQRFLFSSSATVYGMHNQVPFTEEMETSATNPYGYSKVANERMLQDICHADPGFSAGILRYFNPIGAHPSGLLGESPKGVPNNLLPYIMDVAVGKRDNLNIFGNDYDTPDGTGVRDYVHVVDLALGHVAALDYMMKNTAVLLVNLGTGVGSSVLDVVKATEKAVGKTIPVAFLPRRAGDIGTCYAKTQLAKDLLGWEAKRNLEEMCADSWHFVQKQQNK